MVQQIILNNQIYLPRRSNDNYACWEEELAELLVMTSGRMVKELRNQGKRYKVWKAKCTYDALDEATYRAALAVLRSGETIQASVLPDNSDEMVASTFHVESLTPATFAFEKNGKAVWHGLAFQLREVNPHA